MARRTTSIKVFIASPGDVPDERMIVRRVVDKWNARNSDQRNILLHAVGWETHGTPMQGQVAQTRINQTVLADCDILIGIFYSRIGTPTNGFLGGAVEEVETHVNAGKSAMVYFSNAPMPEGSDQNQVNLVHELRAKYQSTSWIGSYDNHHHFESQLLEHLTEILNNETYIDELRRSLEGTPTPEIQYGIYPTQATVLSAEELDMLNAAVTSGSSISRSHEIGRPTIYAGSLTYGMGNNREFERGLHILEKLESIGFVDDRTGYRDVFVVTHKGYSYAENHSRNYPTRDKLSTDAISLLIPAGDPTSPADSILHAIKSDGLIAFAVGDREFDASSSMKLARWEAAIHELIDKGYVQSTGQGVYSFTHTGYKEAELLFYASSSNHRIGDGRASR